MEAFLQFAGMSSSMGLPSLVVGTVLFLYFSIRKQEAVVRTEQLETIERLKAERDEETVKNDDLSQRNTDLILENTKLKTQIIELGGKLHGS